MPDFDLIQNDFTGKDILSLDQFDRQSIETIITKAGELKRSYQQKSLNKSLDGALLTLLFYEPSSRTFGSFAAAVKRLGGQTIDIQNPSHTSSVAKGETLHDTIKVFENYSDAVVLRHPEKGSAEKAAEYADIPILNAGDGAGEHPTQALLDLFTIHEKLEKLDDLTLLIAGDLKNGRTVHSLLRGLTLFSNITIYLLSPESLRLSKEDFDVVTHRGVKLVEIYSENDIPQNAHVWYWTRVQKERFTSLAEYEKVKHSFIVTKDFLSMHGNSEMILMHPLPRVGEITEEVDEDSRSVYLTTQMQNGMFVRMALLELILGKS